MWQSRVERIAELTGEERFGEALEEALELVRDVENPVTLGQVGFLLEQLGRWAEAEDWLRRALDDDPGYVTRHMQLALYSHTSVSADLHHMLGRVLQRQEKTHEAKLHYHLAKRSDPTVELDPMHLAIMSTGDLEDHPEYDAAPTRPPTGSTEFVEYLLSLNSPEEVRQAWAHAPFDDASQVIALVAENMQRQGRFLLAARLRVILDVVVGDPEAADAGWETQGAPHVKQLLDLAEMRQDQSVGAAEAAVLAAGIPVPAGDADLLLHLVWRFIRNDAGTGLVIAETVRPALTAAGREAHAALLVGRAQLGTGRLGAAATALGQAVEQLPDGEPWLADGLVSLAVVLERLGRHTEAAAVARRLESVPVEESDTADLDSALDRAEQLVEDERTQEALTLLRELVPDPHSTSAIRRWVLIGNAHAARGELEQVNEAWRTALFLARYSGGLADQWPILMGLGRVGLATGDRAAAREFYEAALEQARHDPEREGRALLQLGILEVEDDPEAAVAAVTRGLHLLGDEDRAEDHGDHHGPDGPDGPDGSDGSDGHAIDRAGDHAGQPADPVAEEPVPRTASFWRRLRLRRQRRRDTESAAALAEVERVGRLLPLDHVGRAATPDLATAAEILDFLDDVDRLLPLILPPGRRALAAVVAADLADYVCDLPLAIDLAGRALDIATNGKWRDLDAERVARVCLGRLVRLDGDFEAARAHFERGAACALALHDVDGEADARGRLAVTLRLLDLPDLALDHYAFVIDVAERRADHTAAALNRLNMAQSLILLARPEAAAPVMEQAIRGFLGQGLVDLAGFALRVFAVRLRDRTPADDIQAALASLDAAVTSEFGGNAWTFEHLHLAMSLTGRGEHQSARDLLAAMAAGLEQAGNPEITVVGQVEAARILADTFPAHAWELAQRALTAALNRTSQRRLATDCRMVQLALALDQSWDDRADALVPVLLDDWRDLRRKLSADVMRIALADHMTVHLRATVARLLQRGETARAFELWDALQAPAFSDLVDPGREEGRPGADAAGVAGVLALGEVAGAVVAFVHRRPFEEAPVAVATGMSAAELHALLRVFRREVHLFHGHGSRSWIGLSRPLLAGVGPHLPDRGTLVVVLDADVQELPVHAVPLPDGGTLASRFDVVHAPNLTGFAVLRGRARTHPEDAWPRLLTVGVAFPDEARALAIAHGGLCLSGRTLPKQKIHGAMADADVVHFACHGFFDAERPLDSGLLLTSGPGAPGRHGVLSLRDFASRRITTGLVVLSACETGLGRPSPTDYLGLARGLLAAGAAAVLVSLWKIDDVATQRFMLDFYLELWRTADDGHLDPAGALSRTQCAWARTRPAQEWAAFRLMGCPELFDGRHA
ncbi:CHAT domain-containing protein [Streptomyces sp. NPDC096339]|uniref:CHAT domain-containing protein n=1 Tax=Streptomyces sp. NPDC096339 TaxID=3366086 RepID=UPI003808C933